MKASLMNKNCRMQKIRNPFSAAGSNSYNCFGCSPANAAGLHLEFWLDDADLVVHWQPEKKYEGWTGVLHGGIQATLMDEAAAWLVFVQLKTAGVTSAMNTRFLRPAYLANGPFTVRATLLSAEKRQAVIKSSLHDTRGETCAVSEVTYFCFPENIARAKYNYPGAGAFFEK